MGWFDLRENSPGILTNILSSDVQILNGVSEDGIGVILECFGCLFTGLFIGFYYCWQMALVALCLFPCLMFSSVLRTKS